MLLTIGGLVLVLISVALGFLLEKGKPLVLFQPAEFLIIVGGSLGILVAGNPKRNLARLFQALKAMEQHGDYTRDLYEEALKVLYTVFSFSRRRGLGALASQLEKPEESELLALYPAFLADTEALAFLCDSIRVAEVAGLDPEELDGLLLIDLDVQRNVGQQLVASLNRVADSLPGLGIVAAVLGVVVTMQAIDGPAAEIGNKVAAALVGTFLGILLCYGFVGPVASNMGSRNKARAEYLNVLRAGVIAFQRGASPVVAAEYARRSIPMDLRPTIDEMEYELRRNTKIPEGSDKEASAVKA